LFFLAPWFLFALFLWFFLVYYSSSVLYSISYSVILLVSIILLVVAVARLVRHFSIQVLVALFFYFSLGAGLPVLLFALTFFLVVFPVTVGPSFLVGLFFSFVPLPTRHFL
jgi:hypothetical protein